MERRSFLKGATALATSPLVPAKALASLAGSTTATSAAGVAAHKSAVDVAYIWCRMYAENKPNFKPELLTEHLGFSKEVAQSAFKRLLKNNVVRATDIRGIYQSTKPFVDMTQIYNPTTHMSDVIKNAKSKLPEFETPNDFAENTDKPSEHLQDDEELQEAQALEVENDDNSNDEEITISDDSIEASNDVAQTADDTKPSPA